MYTIDFPQSPEVQYPIALVSVLRAILFVTKHSGCDKVQLAGESAGGNLASLCAGLMVPGQHDSLNSIHTLYKLVSAGEDRQNKNWPVISDPSTLITDAQLEAAVIADTTALAFPSVDKVVSMYGVLDQQSWKGTWFGVALGFCFKVLTLNLA